MKLLRVAICHPRPLTRYQHPETAEAEPQSDLLPMKPTKGESLQAFLLPQYWRHDPQVV